ncbi:MAG: benzoate-CoA ligase family protein [Deltaproteobacteria bacterium]|nr:benzoate-CoA ligase family protein [Deltaproteobacteria bacterium]
MASTVAGGNFNVAEELIKKYSSTRGDKIAIRCRDEAVTYRELEQNVNRFANLLRNMGIKPTDRVMIMMPDSPMFVYAFLGSIKCGAWPVPVNAMLGADDYHYLLHDSEARVLVTPESSKAATVQTQHECHRLFSDAGLESLFAAASPEADPHLVKPDDIAFWLYSSGSTGKPKGTPHKHESLVFTADSYAKNVLNITEDDVCFSVSKLFFAYGLGNGLTFPLRFGATAVLLSDPPTPEKVIETLTKYQPSVFFGVPTQYNSLLKNLDGARFPSIRICVSAGEALPPEILRQWKANTGLDILDGIGSTEALHIFISNLSGDIKEGTSGRMVPGYEAKIVDDEDKAVQPGETGHLLIRGTSITPGYWNRPEVNAEKILPDGWFRTGDMYSLQDGYYTYQGRGDDMLKVGGIWVSPMEIEYALIEHRDVNECAVVGQKVEGLVKPFAYVVANVGPESAERDKLAADLLEFIGAKLPKFKRPWRIYFIDELPKTATGKIQRFKLRMNK